MPGGAEPAAVSARAWCRVDLAGGTLDIWPLGLLHPGSRTVNLAIDVAVRVAMRRRRDGYRVVQGDSTVETASAEELAGRPESALAGLVASALGLPPVEIALESDSPRGGGLGASSAIAVAAIAAGDLVAGRPARSAEATSALARDLEARLMGLPTGRQDHFAALLGGALEIVHRPGGEAVRALEVDLEALAASLVVAYTGASHFSAGNNWQIVRRRLEGEPEVVDRFQRIAEVAARVGEKLEAGDAAAVGRLMSEEWSHRRRLAPEISTPAIEELLAKAGAAGAWGGKVCGAGGGGSVAVLAPPERKRGVAEELAAAGARVLECRPAAGPMRVERSTAGDPAAGSAGPE